MKISDFLSPDAVIDSLASSDREGVLRELSERFAAVEPRLAAEQVLQVLEERERLGPTAVGNGVAIPHGKVAGLPGLLGCFARAPAAIPFGASDPEGSRLFFALLAPENAAGAHLRALARISRLLRRDELRQALLDAKDAQSIYNLLVTEDEA